MCVPQCADVERHGGAETGQHGEPEVSGGNRAWRHRGGHGTQAESGRWFGWGFQLPHGARFQRWSMSVLVRIQGPDAPSDGEGEGVRRFDVALPRGLIGPGTQEFLRVVKVCGVGNFPLTEGAFLIGSIRVDSHHRKWELFKSSSVWLGRLPLDGDARGNFFSFPLETFD